MTQKDEAATKAAPAPKAEAAPKDIKHGVTRPKAGTKTGRVWEIADAQSKKAGAPAARKEVIADCMKEEINAATAATQYGRWRKYHGLKAEVRAPKEAKETAPETAEAGVE